MEYEVSIRRLMDNESALKAVASVTFDGVITVHNVKVIKGREGLFVSMPQSEYVDRSGETIRRDIIHIESADDKNEFSKAVLEAYDEKINSKN